MNEDIIIGFLYEAQTGIPDVSGITGLEPGEAGPEDNLGVRLTVSIGSRLVVLAIAGVLREDGKPGVRYARFEGDDGAVLNTADQWILDQA